MGKLLRIVLLQLLLVAGLATAGGQLLATPTAPHVFTDSNIHCLDCPAPAGDSFMDCCIQVHQGCSSCASIHPSLLIASIPPVRTGFDEPHSRLAVPVYTPPKPPPRTVLS